jgi:hypothetical protein
MNDSGPTKPSVESLSEGDSYLVREPFYPNSGPSQVPLSDTTLFSQLLAQALAPKSVPSWRMVDERHATDSYQNVLFSLLRFQHLIGTYPTHITIISHDFKRRRFLDLHVPAIRWPPARVSYVGIDPPERVTPRQVLDEGERMRGYTVWEMDLYGMGPVLGAKRVERGWSVVRENMVSEGVEEDVWRFLRWRGGESGVELYPYSLPWVDVVQ